MKKVFGSIILISGLVFPAFAGSYLDEIKEIEEGFFSTPAKKKPKVTKVKSKARDRETRQTGDLEQMFFEDSISTKAAAPVRSKKMKKRSR